MPSAKSLRTLQSMDLTAFQPAVIAAAHEAPSGDVGDGDSRLDADCMLPRR
jgi:hypothetical protein